MTDVCTPKPYVLGGRCVGLSEAARDLGVGLATIMRNTHAGVIDVAAIKSLVPGEPLKVASQPKAKPYRGPAHFHEDAPSRRPTTKTRNRKIIRRIVATFREARP